MTEKEAYFEALRKADAAGNVEDAKRLAQAISEKFGDNLETKEPVEEKDTSTAGQAFFEGLAEGVSGGFSGELSAAADLPLMAATAYTVKKQQAEEGMQESLPGIKEMYAAQVKHEEENLEKFKNKYPKAYWTGDIAGSILGSVTGLSALRVAKGGKAALKTASGFLTSMGLFGGIHGAGRSNSETIEGRLRAGAEGAVLGVASDALIPGAGRLAKSKVIDPLKEKLRNVSAENFLKFLGGDALKTSRQLNEVGKELTGWSERLVNYTDVEGKPLVKLSSSLEDLDIVFQEERKKAGKDMGAILRDIDSGEKGVSLYMDPEALYNKLNRNHVSPLLDEGLSQTDKRAGLKLQKELKDTFLSNLETQTDVDKLGNPLAKSKIVNKNLNLVKLHQMASDVHKDHRLLIRNASTSDQIKYLDARKGMAKDITDSIDDIVEMSGKSIDADLSSQYKVARQKFGDLIEAEKVITGTLNSDDAANFVTKLFRDTIFRYSSVGGTVALVSNTPYVRETALAIAGLRALQNMNIARKSTALGLQPVITALSTNPKKYAPLATRLIQASATSTDAFIDQVMQVSSEVDLKENPLMRSSDEVIKRKDVVLTRLEDVSPDIANELRKAIDNGDRTAISGIMASLAEQSKSGIIQEGIGWDGHAVTESEVQKVESWISSIRDVRKRSNLSKQFGADRKLPEEMLQGSSGQTSPSQFIYQKAKDKVRNPEY